MPIVPRAQNEVALAPATDAKLVAADAGPGIGPGLQQFGQGLEQVAQAGVNIADIRADDEARRLDIQHMDTVTKLHQMVLNARGENAPAAVADATQELQDANRDLIGQASNGLVERMVRNNIGLRTQQTVSGWADYANGQEREAGDQAIQTHSALQQNQALANPIGSDASQLAIDGGVNDIKDLAGRQGWDPNVTAAHILQYTSSYHRQRVDQLYQGIDGNSEAANSYVDTHKNEMTDADVDSSRALLQRDLINNRAQMDVGDGIRYAMGHSAAQQPQGATGQPGAPAGPGYATQPITPDQYSDYLNRVGGHEAHGRYIRNQAGASSAYGPDQITNPTWRGYYSRLYGGNQAQADAARNDPQVNSRIALQITRDNASTLQAAHQPVTPGNLFLLHFLGPGDGVRVLRADPNAPVRSVVQQQSIDSNPTILAGHATAGSVRAWANNAISGAHPVSGTGVAATGTSSYAPAPAPPPGEQAWSTPIRAQTTTVPGGQFGASRAYGTHQAHDYAGVPVGTPVYPMAHGTITHVMTTPGGGNQVVIDYGGGYVSTYMHLADGSTANLHVGQQVTPNDIVGGVGATGAAARGVHLHAALMTPQGAVDPSRMAGHVFSGGSPQGPNADANTNYNGMGPPPPDGSRINMAQAFAYFDSQPWSDSRRNRAREGLMQWQNQSDAVVTQTQRVADQTITRQLAQLAQGNTDLTNMNQLDPEAVRNASPSVLLRVSDTIRANNQPQPVAANSQHFRALLLESSQDPERFAHENLESYGSLITPGEITDLTRAQMAIVNRRGAQPADIQHAIEMVLPETTLLQTATSTDTAHPPTLPQGVTETPEQARQRVRNSVTAPLLGSVQRVLHELYPNTTPTQAQILDVVRSQVTMIHRQGLPDAPVYQLRPGQLGQGASVSIPNGALRYIRMNLIARHITPSQENISGEYIRNRSQYDGLATLR